MQKENLISSLKRHGFSAKIVEAFKKVPRENFIPQNLRHLAYEDSALPLEHGATISQPYTIAFMLNLLELKRRQKILEIGSGSGYVLALLAELTDGKIYGIEISENLARASRKNLSKYKNVRVVNKNGADGLPENAPFDRILISAAANSLPLHLVEQLAPSGIIVAPVQNSILQIKKQKRGHAIKEFPGFVFVPLVADEK